LPFQALFDSITNMTQLSMQAITGSPSLFHIDSLLLLDLGHHSSLPSGSSPMPVAGTPLSTTPMLLHSAPSSFPPMASPLPTHISQHLLLFHPKQWSQILNLKLLHPVP